LSRLGPRPEFSTTPAYQAEKRKKKGGFTMKKATNRHITVERLLLVAGTCFIATMLSIAPGQARTTDFGVRAGVYPDQEDAFLGAEALFGMTENKRWFGNPNVEHVFIDDGDLTSISFDMHYDFVKNQPYTIWAGAGPTLIHKDRNLPDNDDTRDAGVNLLVGGGATKGDVRPYGQLKVVVANDNEAVVGIGVRF
jgi:hypothetical protein